MWVKISAGNAVRITYGIFDLDPGQCVVTSDYKGASDILQFKKNSITELWIN